MHVPRPFKSEYVGHLGPIPNGLFCGRNCQHWPIWARRVVKLWHWHLWHSTKWSKRQMDLWVGKFEIDKFLFDFSNFKNSLKKISVLNKKWWSFQWYPYWGQRRTGQFQTVDKWLAAFVGQFVHWSSKDWQSAVCTESYARSEQVNKKNFLESIWKFCYFLKRMILNFLKL